MERVASLGGDIRFWIAVFFLVRLIGITYPPIETHHNWRQTGTLMSVRAMLIRNQPDMLYPKTAIAGFDRSNVVGSEFPLFNYSIFLCNKWFGAADWYGRLINLIVSSFAVWCFFRIIRRLFGGDTAHLASLLLLSSIWFMFSRKVMPDIFSYSLVLVGVELLWIFRFRAQWWLAVLGGIMLTAGLLSKMPSAAGVCLIIPLLLDGGVSKIIRLSVALVAAFSIAIMSVWYFAWVPELIDNGAYQLYWPKSLYQGFQEILSLLPETAYRIYFTALYSYGAFAACMVGVVLLYRERRSLRAMMVAVLILLLFFMVRTGAAFAEQDYYMIPFVPFMALTAAVALHRIEATKLKLLFLSVCILEGFLNQQHDLQWPEHSAYKLRMSEQLRPFSAEGEPIAFVSDLNPSDMYFADHPGWLVAPDEMNDATLLNRFRKSGCRLMAVNNQRGGLKAVRPSLKLIAETECWRIYSLGQEP